MTLEILNRRLAELSPFRKQLESQIHMVDGHIQEVQYLINELQKPAEQPTEEPKELTDEEYVSAEMQVM